jgi:SulP family sulfate permease
VTPVARVLGLLPRRADWIAARRAPGRDVLAGVTVALVALPLALVRVMILRMSRVSTIDATGARMLGDAITQLERRGIVVLLSGVSAKHGDVLVALGVADHLRREGLIFPDTPSAIAYARGIAHSEQGLPVSA